MTDYVVHVTREQSEGKILKFDYGFCATYPKNPEKKPYDFNDGLELIINRGMRDGIIKIGGFDDRKYRLNDPIINESNDQIIVPLGLTYWKAYLDDLNRPFEDTQKLRKLGKLYHNDELSFFARALGIEIFYNYSSFKLNLFCPKTLSLHVRFLADLALKPQVSLLCGFLPRHLKFADCRLRISSHIAFASGLTSFSRSYF